MLMSVGKHLWVPLLVAAVLSLTLAASVYQATEAHEVWLVDQSNSPGKTYGGTLYVWEGADLNGSDASSATPIAVIDLGGATSDLCLAQTGANPVRPHMLDFNSGHSHGVLTFVASGHVVVFDAANRASVACIRTSEGFLAARQAHAATPAPDGSFILVTNQGGRLLERIDSDFATNTFSLNPAATLNLATCTTPAGNPCQHPDTRPLNSPIVALVDSTSKLAFVTLAGGGLFVVDPNTEPMQILAEYDKNTVHANGFAGAEAKGGMYINSGAGAAATNPSEFDIYRFPLTGYSPLNPPNSPALNVVFSDDTVPPADERDAHGLVLTKHDRYLWVLDRLHNVAEVIDTGSNQRVNTVNLAGTLSEDPTSDLAGIAPDGNRIFLSLRGPNPLSGSPHAASGSTPGLGVVQVEQGGRHGVLKSVVRITNIDGAGIERADPHDVSVRRK